MAATDQARRHFDVIASTMAEKTAQQRRGVALTSIQQRIEIGFRLGAVPQSPAIKLAQQRRASAQIGLAEQRQKLRHDRQPT